MQRAGSALGLFGLVVVAMVQSDFSWRYLIGKAGGAITTFHNHPFEGGEDSRYDHVGFSVKADDLVMTTYDITSRTSLDFLWGHPQLELFPKPIREIPEQKAKLYLVPTSFGEEYDPDFAPIPCSAIDLPELHQWTMKFAVCVLEIWAGRRQPVQLAKWCHRVIFSDLLKQVGSQKDVGRIRTIHQQEPIDGVCESTITVRYGDRLRAMVVRFEGLDQRWLCTALELI